MKLNNFCLFYNSKLLLDNLTRFPLNRKYRTHKLDWLSFYTHYKFWFPLWYRLYRDCQYAYTSPDLNHFMFDINIQLVHTDTSPLFAQHKRRNIWFDCSTLEKSLKLTEIQLTLWFPSHTPPDIFSIVQAFSAQLLAYSLCWIWVLSAFCWVFWWPSRYKWLWSVKE